MIVVLFISAEMVPSETAKKEPEKEKFLLKFPS